MAKTSIDKLRSAGDSERLGQTVTTALGELDDVREWAEALGNLADAIEMAVDACQEYTDAEGREEKQDAKDEALNALQEVLEAWDTVTGLPAVDGLVSSP